MNTTPTKIFAFITDTEIAHSLYVSNVISGVEFCFSLAVSEPIFQAKKFHRSNTNCTSIYSELSLHFTYHSFMYRLHWAFVLASGGKYQYWTGGDIELNWQRAYYSCVAKWKQQGKQRHNISVGCKLCIASFVKCLRPRVVLSRTVLVTANG